MTRRFLDDIRGDINAQIVTNYEGDITADILRPMMIDTIDSTIDDEAVIGSNTPVIALTVNDTTWTVIPADTSVGGDAEFLIIDLLDDKITSSSTAGWTYDVTALASISGANSSVFEMAILQNGTPEGYIGTVNTSGPSKPVSVQAYNLELSTPISTAFQLAIRSVGVATADIDVTNSALIVAIKPTNNP